MGASFDHLVLLRSGFAPGDGAVGALGWILIGSIGSIGSTWGRLSFGLAPLFVYLSFWCSHSFDGSLDVYGACTRRGSLSGWGAIGSDGSIDAR
jgi:hypothetical protein